MRLAIAHCTTYRFDGPVFLEPHALRLTPRGDPAQRLEAFSLSISPRPQAVSHQLDAAGNAVHRAWFLDLVGGLEIRMAAVVETMRDNPFDFLQEPMEAPGVLLAPALAPAFQAPEDVEAVALLVHQAGPLARKTPWASACGCARCSTNALKRLPARNRGCWDRRRCSPRGRPPAGT